MNDFETRLADRLNRDVDAEIAYRTPPRFQPDRTPTPSTRRRPVWVAPLLAAACVAAVAAGTVGVTQVLADRSAPPATHGPTPGPTSGPTTGPTGHGSSTSPTPSSGPPSSAPPPPSGYHFLTLGTALVPVPDGWVAHRDPARGPGGSEPINRGWCLTPASTRVSGLDCPGVRFTPLDPARNPLDVDVQGGLATNPHPCGQSGITETLQHDNRTFGGRPAQWRRWHDVCGNGRVLDPEQYVVATSPAYLLFGASADAATHEVMQQIARTSGLPLQDAPLRLMDRGLIRAVTPTADGWTVTIVRVVGVGFGSKATEPDGTQTYRYTIRKHLANGGSSDRVTVGELLIVNTDGHSVTDWYTEP